MSLYGGATFCTYHNHGNGGSLGGGSTRKVHRQPRSPHAGHRRHYVEVPRPGKSPLELDEGEESEFDSDEDDDSSTDEEPPITEGHRFRREGIVRSPSPVLDCPPGKGKRLAVHFFKTKNFGAETYGKTTFFIAPGGSDMSGNGSYEYPYKLLDKVASIAAFILSIKARLP
jgi:hypothetical protein